LILLRSLTSGEFQALGSDRSRRLNVRVVAATNRSLNELASNRQFRRDLLFRLRYFHFEVPPLRERGDDWRLLLAYVLERLQRRHGVAKHFSPRALQLLEGYKWPGNIRELISVATTGYALSDGEVIESDSFQDLLETDTPDTFRPEETLRALTNGGDFWELVHRPFLERDLNRSEVRRLVARGLRRSQGSYRRLLERWRLPAEDYQRFMDFLRHHRLKPGGLS